MQPYITLSNYTNIMCHTLVYFVKVSDNDFDSPGCLATTTPTAIYQKMRTEPRQIPIAKHIREGLQSFDSIIEICIK